MDEVQLATLYVVTEGAYLHKDGQAIAEELMSHLGIEKGDLLEGAYMDLMENK